MPPKACCFNMLPKACCFNVPPSYAALMRRLITPLSYAAFSTVAVDREKTQTHTKRQRQSHEKQQQ